MMTNNDEKDLYGAINQLPNPYEDKDVRDALQTDSRNTGNDELGDLKEEVTLELEHVTSKRRRSRRARILIKTVIEVCSLAIIIFILLEVIFGISIVKGSSMEDTLKDGDIVIYYRLCKSYTYNDIIVVNAESEGINIIKRIVGLPDDTVMITSKGTLLVNGSVPDEPYLKSTLTTLEDRDMPVTLASDEYFLLGDNRAVSKDSRSSDIGNISADCIKGKVLCYIRFF